MKVIIMTKPKYYNVKFGGEFREVQKIDYQYEVVYVKDKYCEYGIRIHFCDIEEIVEVDERF